MFHKMAVLPPHEFERILQDPKTRRVFGLDTEFDVDIPSAENDTPEIKKRKRRAVATCDAPLLGCSISAWHPDVGYCGAYWDFENNDAAYFRKFMNKVLFPLMADERNIFAIHPIKVEMLCFRRRGLTDDKIKATLHCTFALAHLVDENMPKGLKALSKALLSYHGQKTFKQTESAINKVAKDNNKHFKALCKLVWEVYRDYRKKAPSTSKSKSKRKTPLKPPVELDPKNPEWQTFALEMPHKLKRAEVIERVTEKYGSVYAANTKRIQQEMFSRYGALDAILTLRIYDRLMPRLKPELYENFLMECKVCHPLVTEMEETGLYINRPLLEAIKGHMETKLTSIEQSLAQTWGAAWSEYVADAAARGEPVKAGQETFNPNSSKQVPIVLWAIWRLRPPAYMLRRGELISKYKTDTGLPTVDKSCLEVLVEKAPKNLSAAIQTLLDYRKVSKILGTYVYPWLIRSGHSPLGRIHPSFWPCGTRTTRFSSSDPNGENVPRGSSMPLIDVPVGADVDAPPYGLVTTTVMVDGKKVKTWRVESLRKAVGVPEGWGLVSADLSQIENRFVTHASSDPVLKSLYCDWECAVCYTSGQTTQPLHSCPTCGSAESSRDKEDPDQPALLTWSCGACGNKGKNLRAETPHACPKCQGGLVYAGFCLGKDIHAKTAHSVGLTAEYVFGEARQQAKCVSLKTWIPLSDGRFKRLEQFLPKKHTAGVFDPAQGDVVGPGGSAPVASVIYNGVQETYVVVTRRGVLRCTGNHRIQTINGLVKASDITTGTKLPLAELPLRNSDHKDVAVTVDIFGDTTDKPGVKGPYLHPEGVATVVLDSDWGYLAGVIAGDGTATSSDGFHVSVGSDDTYAEWRQTVIRHAQKLNIKAVETGDKRFVRLGSRRVGRFLRQLELSDGTRKNMRVPSWVMNGSYETAMAYVCGLIDTDGTVNSRGPIAITTKFFDFAAELALLCRSLGLAVSVSPSWNRKYSRWYLKINILSAGLPKIAATGFMKHQDKAAKLASRLKLLKCPRLPKDDEVLLVLKDTDPRLHLNKKGSIKVGDLHVDTPDHLYTPGGIVTHNSVNHAFNYGMGANTYAKNAGISKKKAEQYLGLLAKTYAQVKTVLVANVERWIKDTGIVTMFDGKRQRNFRHAKLLMDAGLLDRYRYYGYVREGANAVAQGGVGIVMKRAMLWIRDVLRMHDDPEVRRTKLSNQIHDEIIYEAPVSVLDKVQAIVCWCLENIIYHIDNVIFSTPVIADSASGDNWEDIH